RLARHRQAADRFHPGARPSGHRQLPDAHGHHVRGDQSRRRHPLFRSRPARSPRTGTRMTPGSLPLATGRAARRSRLLRLLAEFVESRGAAAALVAVAALVAIALFAPLIAPTDPYDLAGLSILDSLLPPGSHAMSGMTYWLGTDDQGRDLLSAIIYG